IRLKSGSSRPTKAALAINERVIDRGLNTPRINQGEESRGKKNEYCSPNLPFWAVHRARSIPPRNPHPHLLPLPGQRGLGEQIVPPPRAYRAVPVMPRL